MVKIPADFKESGSGSVLNTSENPTCKACRVHYMGKILYKAQQGHTEIFSSLLMASTVDVCIEFNWAASQLGPDTLMINFLYSLPLTFL